MDLVLLVLDSVCHVLDPVSLVLVPFSGPPLKNHKNIGFISNIGPDPLKNHKATNPNGGVWQADNGPFIVVFGSSIPSSTKKKKF